MKSLSIKEVAELVGISRQSVYKKIKQGKLSKQADNTIQLAEVLRVYPDISIDYKDDKQVEKVVNQNSTCVNEVELRFTNEKVKMLEKALAEKDLQILNLSKQVDKLLSMNEQLQIYALPNPERKKKWWFFSK